MLSNQGTGTKKQIIIITKGFDLIDLGHIGRHFVHLNILTWVIRRWPTAAVLLSVSPTVISYSFLPRAASCANALAVGLELEALTVWPTSLECDIGRGDGGDDKD